jgi:putative ABC transport system substrate-binding protein
MSYGANLGEIRRRSASYVDRILKAAKPSDLLGRLSSSYRLKTVKAVGLTIPPSLLLRADQAIDRSCAQGVLDAALD